MASTRDPEDVGGTRGLQVVEGQLVGKRLKDVLETNFLFLCFLCCASFAAGFVRAGLGGLGLQCQTCDLERLYSRCPISKL